MKKTAFAIALFAGILSNTFAQERKHELTLGYGIGTTSEFVDAFSDVLVTGISGGHFKSDNGSYTGSFHIGYKYGLTDRLWLGGTFLYESGKSDALVDDQRQGKFNDYFYTLAAEARYNYLSKEKFALYGLLGAGATLYHQKYAPDHGGKETDSQVHFNFQLTPLGIRYGGKWGVFAEAGFGYKGVISLGVFAGL